MNHTLVIEIPEEAYRQLLESASLKGRRPETVAADLLAEQLADPVMKLAGCLAMPFTDVGDRHDDYIGEGLLEQPEEQ